MCVCWGEHSFVQIFFLKEMCIRDSSDGEPETSVLKIGSRRQIIIPIMLTAAVIDYGIVSVCCVNYEFSLVISTTQWGCIRDDATPPFNTQAIYCVLILIIH